MSLINFTVEYDLLAAVTDTDGSGSDADIVPLTGPVTFSPVFRDNRAALASEYSPRAAGLKLLPISGYLDSDGRLKDRPAGTVGVRLPADDPVLGLSELVYQVSWDVHTTEGQPVKVDTGYFTAPSTDSTVNLADVLESSASAAFGASRIVSGTFGDGTVTFTNADGTTIGPITIPEGVLVFTDNGDSTWSVG